MSGKHVRAVIVGAGLMGRWHAHAAVRAGGRVTGVVDADGERARRLAGSHRGCQASDRLENALAGADVVHICTPTSSHVALAEQAIRAGVHVLVEKPVASSVADTESLLALASSQGVLVCPVHQFVFQRGVQSALARMPEIGALRHIDFTIRSAGGRVRDDSELDRIAVEILPHPLSLLARLVPAPVDELEWSTRRSVAGEFRGIAQAGDVSIAMLISLSGRPTLNRLQLVGTRGTIHIDLFHGFCTIENGAVSRLRKATQPYTYSAALATAATLNLVHRLVGREPAYPGLSTIVGRFYRAAAGLGGIPITPEETVTIARAGDCLSAQILGEHP